MGKIGEHFANLGSMDNMENTVELKKPPVGVSVRLDPCLLAEIDGLSGSIGITRQELMQKLIHEAATEAVDGFLSGSQDAVRIFSEHRRFYLEKANITPEEYSNTTGRNSEIDRM